jgi:hypothetical protein
MDGLQDSRDRLYMKLYYSPPLRPEASRYVDLELSEEYVMPGRPDPASLWGVFGMVSGWLVKTRNFALILITGMLGFGLFGSLVSSCVRGQITNTGRQALLPDLPFAVIRGLSAALVVFLGVMGGLAVFTTAQARPNPHVLFFACLVGAVFTEKIWNWAQRQLEEKFSESPKPKDKDSQKEPADTSVTTP